MAQLDEGSKLQQNASEPGQVLREKQWVRGPYSLVFFMFVGRELWGAVDRGIGMRDRSALIGER